MEDTEGYLYTASIIKNKCKIFKKERGRKMKEFKYVITDELGLHARPAGLLVKEAGKFQSAISMDGNGKTGDAKRILGIMSMGIKKGCEVTVKADGSDEEEAIKALEAFFKANL